VSGEEIRAAGGGVRDWEGELGPEGNRKKLARCWGNCKVVNQDWGQGRKGEFLKQGGKERKWMKVQGAFPKKGGAATKRQIAMRDQNRIF